MHLEVIFQLLMCGPDVAITPETVVSCSIILTLSFHTFPSFPPCPGTLLPGDGGLVHWGLAHWGDVITSAAPWGDREGEVSNCCWLCLAIFLVIFLFLFHPPHRLIIAQMRCRLSMENWMFRFGLKENISKPFSYELQVSKTLQIKLDNVALF